MVRRLTRNIRVKKTAAASSTLPVGTQTFWCVPLDIRDTGSAENALLILDEKTEVVVKVGSSGSHLTFAHFCDENASKTVDGQSSDYLNPVVTAPGEYIADHVIVYEDGTEHRQSIRRSFEINQVQTLMQSGFASRQHQR